MVETNTTAGSESDGETARRTFLKGSATALGVGSMIGLSQSDVPGTLTEQAAASPPPDRAESKEGMVSTVHPQATEVGVNVLKNGGNAIDAAVAVQFALNVVQPHSSGIGGGGFMVIYSADEDELYTIDNRERAPLGADKGMFLNDCNEPVPFEKRHTSGEAVGVPGTLRACDVSLKRFGTRTIDELISPAIDLARESGETVEVGKHLAESIRNHQDLFNDAAREVFVPNGEPLAAGDELVQPDLADTFETIRDDGIGAFYKGAIADAIADTVQQTGGSMRTDDLARYNVTVDHPEYAEYDDVTVRTQSLPSSGGLTIGQILKLLEPLKLQQYGPNAPETYEALLEAFGLAYADRGEYMGDKAFVDAPWQGLFNDEYLQKRRKKMAIDKSAGGPPQAGNPWNYQPGTPYKVDAVGASELENIAESHPATPNKGQTTHFTTADSEGNLVSWTSTIEQFFGTKIMVPDHGFMLNNELTDFDAVPGGPNEVAPGKRPLSSTSPTIVIKDGNPFMTVGSPGGKTIITTVARIILNVVEFDMNLDEAVAAPRVYRDAEPAVLYEADVPNEVQQTLRDYGFKLTEKPTMLGNAQAIKVTEDGRYVGIADSRRDGSVIGL